MATNLKTCTSQAQYDTELNNAGGKLVVIDFFATWCGPCLRIAPEFAQFAERYPNVVFLKVDVDQCQDLAMKEQVTAMPTFVFYKNKTRIDDMRGADTAALEQKIKQHNTSTESAATDTSSKSSLVPGHSELNSLLNKAESECLNESDDHPFSFCLSSGGGYLESDCDEQLLLHLTFQQPVKIHSLHITAPVAEKGECCPKTLKLFTNVPNALDFDKAEGMDAVQTIELSADDMTEESLIPLKFVKFQNVQNITLFFQSNHGGETTQIDFLSLIGSPLNATNMSDFKRVAGKKGESH